MSPLCSREALVLSLHCQETCHCLSYFLALTTLQQGGTEIDLSWSPSLFNFTDLLLVVEDTTFVFTASPAAAS